MLKTVGLSFYKIKDTVIRLNHHLEAKCEDQLHSLRFSVNVEIIKPHFTSFFAGSGVKILLAESLKLKSTLMSSNRFALLYIGGHPVHSVGRKQLVDAMLMDKKSKKDKATLVFDANGQGLSMRETDQEYREALSQADIVHADSEFIVKISRLLYPKYRIQNRSATTDMIHDFAGAAVENGLSYYLLGGPEGLATRAAERLQEMYPDLKIAGVHHGYFKQQEEGKIVKKINDSNADILWVGLGKPKEQLFCVRHSRRFRATWVITCGGCFNYITGDYKRAPEWMQRFALEWLHRMITRPRQLFWRYLFSTPHALYLVVKKWLI